MKKLRQFRIPITDSGQFRVEVSVDGKVIVKNPLDVTLTNISSSGLGLDVNIEIELPKLFDLSISYKGFNLTTKVQVARELKHQLDSRLRYYGIEFLGVDLVVIQSLLKIVIDNVAGNRLKSLMMEMIDNEGRAMHSKQDGLKISSKIIIDLFRSFQQYTNSSDLINLFSLEVKRNINASTFRYYVFENDGTDVSIWNFKKNKKNNDFYPLIGDLKSVKDSGKIKSSRLSQKYGMDEFYSLTQTILDDQIDTYILAPVIDKSGCMIGIIEFTNKFDYELFTEEDRNEVALFSTVLGLALSMNIEVESFGYAQTLIEMVDKSNLIGVSEENRYLNSFVDSCAKLNENVLVTGEFGVGKKSLCENIHNKSENSNFGIGVINCHDITNQESINDLLLSNDHHNGVLELYTGGTIICQDINYLSLSLQEYLFSRIQKSTDIRFIATSSQNIETLEHSKMLYPPLLQFLSVRNIRIPSLRERKDDIIPLMHYFSYKICSDNNIAQKNISSDIANYFKNYDWPGNISELKVAMERLVLLSQGQKTLAYNRTRALPILDREVNNDLFFGIDLHSYDIDTSDINDDQFEELYFYFYVEKIISTREVDLIEMPNFFDMREDEFYERVFHAHELSLKVFGDSSDNINFLLERKAA